jgi:hypothetical protein
MAHVKNIKPVADSVSASGNVASAIPITLTGSDADGIVWAFKLSNLPTVGHLYVDPGLTMLAQKGHAYVATGGNALTLYFKPDVNFDGTATSAMFDDLIQINVRQCINFKYTFARFSLRRFGRSRRGAVTKLRRLYQRGCQQVTRQQCASPTM